MIVADIFQCICIFNGELTREKNVCICALCLTRFICRVKLHVICFGVLTDDLHILRFLSKVICAAPGPNRHNACVLHFAFVQLN